MEGMAYFSWRVWNIKIVFSLHFILPYFVTVYKTILHLAFDKVDYVLCETFDINEEVNKYYQSKKMYEYDRVFITDLFINESLLEKIANDSNLKNKFFIFDHHKTYLDISKKYSFTTVKIYDEKGKCSATTIFYEYLVDNLLLNKDDKKISEFCELTRRHDTWEWKDIYNDEKSHELALLFDAMSPNSYIDSMYNKLTDLGLLFEYNEFELFKREYLLELYPNYKDIIIKLTREN